MSRITIAGIRFMSGYSKECILNGIEVLGIEAGEDEVFLRELARKMENYPEIAEEFGYYIENGDFLCKAKIDGYTVIDILVWQMDHFKAQLDRDRYEMKNNPGKMILRAFDTMLKMKQEPEKYKELLQSETGTDYPGKY